MPQVTLLFAGIPAADLAAKTVRGDKVRLEEAHPIRISQGYSAEIRITAEQDETVVITRNILVPMWQRPAAHEYGPGQRYLRRWDLGAVELVVLEVARAFLKVRHMDGSIFWINTEVFEGLITERLPDETPPPQSTWREAISSFAAAFRRGLNQAKW